MSAEPFFSVITASFNRASFIETAILSVMDQGYDDLEHIIVDGGSTDGTLELLKKYPHLRVFSAPDKGVYDAFNKGIGYSRGKVVNFLNSDDRWSFGFLPEIRKHFNDNPSLDIISTRAARYTLASHGEWRVEKSILPLNGGISYFKEISGRGPAINAWFIARRLFDQIGNFKEAYQISADYEFCTRAVLGNAQIFALDIETYHYLEHAESLTLHSDQKKFAPGIHESYQIIEDFLKNEEIDLNAREFLKKRYRWLSIREIKREARRLNIKSIISALFKFLKGLTM